MEARGENSTSMWKVRQGRQKEKTRHVGIGHAWLTFIYSVLLNLFNRPRRRKKMSGKLARSGVAAARTLAVHEGETFNLQSKYLSSKMDGGWCLTKLLPPQCHVAQCLLCGSFLRAVNGNGGAIGFLKPTGVYWLRDMSLWWLNFPTPAIRKNRSLLLELAEQPSLKGSTFVTLGIHAYAFCRGEFNMFCGKTA